MADNDYNDGNRAFLQALMARGTMTFLEGQKVLAAIFTVQEDNEISPNEVTQEDLDSYIALAADKISFFDYEIRSTVHQLTKERVHAIVNATSDPITQIATTRTQEEMFYVRRLIDAMFETYNTRRREVMAVTSMQALERKITKGIDGRQSLDNGQSVDKGVTNEQAEKTLKGLVAEGWLERSKEGYYTLSPRALLELQTWLVTEYNDDEAEPDDWQRIKFCEACKGIVTIGQRCADIDCNARLHEICQAGYLKKKNECPKCHKAWDGKRFVGQKVITTSEEYLKGKRRSGGPARKNRVEEEVEDEADDDDDDGE